MARIAESAGLMEGSGGAARVRTPDASQLDLAALREHVETTIARSAKLREMAERIGFTPADVASEALARFLRVADQQIENPAGWMVGAGRNFIFDQHRKGVHREEALEPGSQALDTPRDGEQLPVEESLDRRFENKLYDAAVRRLDRRDQRAIAAFELAGSMRAVEKQYGIPKSSVQRAFKRLQSVISSETGRQATRRARSRALAYHLGYMSPAQAAEVKERLSWDTGLLMAVRALELGGRRAVAVVPPGALAGRAGESAHTFGDRFAALADGIRQHAYSVIGRSSGHEADAAGGVAAGGGAGLATKAIVAACIGGSAAAGVGGACVATGVVDLPGDEGKQVAEKTVPEEPTATAETPTPVEETPPPADTTPQETEQTAPTVQKPVEQQSTEFYGGGSTSGSSSNATSLDFGAPTSAGGGSGGGGGGATTKENFGP